MAESSSHGAPPPAGAASAEQRSRYHLLLAAVAMFILGPLGGVTASYMNFSLGFFVGGQVLAGILGSVVTYGYGAEGKHGANYMQTMAASVASMCAMSVLIQAMVWLGMPLPPAWQLVLYFGCMGMFGVGVGMLYTPMLVDRLQLDYPSGHAVANILRALTDKRCSRGPSPSWAAAPAGGIAVAASPAGSPAVERHRRCRRPRWARADRRARASPCPRWSWAASAALLTPYLRAIGWLGAHDPFRKIGFLIALAMIFGAALVDLALLAVQAVRRVARARRRPPRRRSRRRSTRPARRLGGRLGRGAGRGGDAGAGPAHRLHAVRARAGAPVRAHQRHLVRHHRPEPHLQRVRDVGAADVAAGPADPARWG